MATIVTTATTPNLDPVTREAVFRKLALDTGMLFCGVATGGSVSTLEDTGNLKSANADASEWVGGWIRVSQTTGHVAPEGEIAPVTGYEPEIGEVSFDPYFSDVISAGDRYELWKINPKIVIDILDQCLLHDLYLPCWTVLSEVADFDMEQESVSDWSDTNATVTKQSSMPRLSTAGKRYLRVVSSSDGGYAESNSLLVEPRRTVYFGAVGRVTSAGYEGRLSLWDKTNDAEIASVNLSRRAPTRLWRTPLIPDDCYEVSIRLISVNSGDVTEWDEVIFFDTSSVDISLPWWVKNQDQVKGYFRLEALSIGEYALDPVLRGEEDARWDTIPQYGGYTRFKGQARQGFLTEPVFIYGSRNETAFEDDNEDFKYLDINLVLACLKYKLYRFHSQPIVTGLLDSINFKSMLGEVSMEWNKIAEREAPEVDTTIDSPTPWGLFTNPRFDYGEF